MMCKKSDFITEEEQRDHKLKLAKIEAEKQMFRESPYLFVFLNLSKSALTSELVKISFDGRNLGMVLVVSYQIGDAQ